MTKSKLTAITSIALTSCILLASCSKNADEKYSESVTISLTESEAVPQAETESPEAQFGFGNYTEANVTEEASDYVTVLGEKYDLNDYQSCLTVDADSCFDVTDEELESIQKLWERNLWYIDVKNCKNHDLSFLAKIEGITSIRFWDVQGNDLDYIKDFTDLQSAEFVNYDGDAMALLDTVTENENMTYLAVDAKNFSFTEGMKFITDSRIKTSYSSADSIVDTPAPEDEPYVVASPTVVSGDEHSYVTFTDEKYPNIKEKPNTFCAYICNPTDEDISVYNMWIEDSLGLYESGFVPMADGEKYLPLDITVPAGENYAFELTADMFDYSAVQNGAYNVKFEYGEFDDGKELSACCIFRSTEDSGAERLGDEQKKVFDKAYEYMTEYFGCTTHMTEEYASSHTADEFISQFTDAFTYDYASSLCSRYIDEDGNLKAIDGDRGSSEPLIDKCFYPIETDDGIDIVCVSVNYSPDFSYRAWYELCRIHMTSSESVPRVDEFTLWF